MTLSPTPRTSRPSRPASAIAGPTRRELLGGLLAASMASCARRPSNGGSHAVWDSSDATVLEHVDVVLGEASWRAVRAEGRLERLGAVDAGLPAFRPPGPLTEVVYLRGRNTYVALMAPGNHFGVPGGLRRLGLLVSDERALDRLAERAARTRAR